MLYESMLLFGVLVVAFLLPNLALGMGLGIVLPGPALLLHFLLVPPLYFIWYWLHGGQTLAMQTWRIRLVDVQGGRLRLAQALLRYLAALFSCVIGGAGFMWALFDRDRQFLHDRIAGTRLIAAPPTTASSPPPAGTSHSA